MKQLKFVLCNIGRLHESDIDQTAFDVLQETERVTITMEEFLEIILKLKAICLSRSHMEDGYPSGREGAQPNQEMVEYPAETVEVPYVPAAM